MKQVVVPFHNWQLVAFEDDKKEHWVAVRPVAKALGIAVYSQQRKIQHDPKFNCKYMYSTAADGKQHKMLCVPIGELNGWLFAIGSRKVRAEAATKLRQFQKLCQTIDRRIAASL